MINYKIIAVKPKDFFLSRQDFSAVAMLGKGKSSYYLLERIGNDIPNLILTEYPDPSLKLKGKNLTIKSTADFKDFFSFISNKQKPLIVICTCIPERFEQWLDKLKQHQSHFPPSTIFVLPHLPNPAVHRLLKEYPSSPIIICDYFPGAGTITRTNNTVTVNMGSKEKQYWSYLKSQNSTSSRETHQINKVIKALSSNRATVIKNFHAIHWPTNAVLHTAGLLAHQIQRRAPQLLLKEKKAIAILKQFEHLLEKEENTEVNKKPEKKLFYKDMPSIAADILMPAMDKEIQKVKDAVKKRHPSISQSDLPKTILAHLISKYKNAFIKIVKRNPESIPFSDFIQNNPPYQNPNLYAPEASKQHRFIREELATLLEWHQLAKKLDLELPVIEYVIKLLQDISGAKYLTKDKTIGKDAPTFIKGLSSTEEWVNHIFLTDYQTEVPPK